MPSHFQKPISKYEYIDDILDYLKIEEHKDRKVLQKQLLKMTRDGLGNLYHHMWQFARRNYVLANSLLVIDRFNVQANHLGVQFTDKTEHGSWVRWKDIEDLLKGLKA